MYRTYENFGQDGEVITITRMVPTTDGLDFLETIIKA